MSDDAFMKRMDAAADRLTDLGNVLERGGPWPLADRFDHAPEASWGPRETLAHMEEMLAFWLGEAERILDSPDASVSFGRMATDDVRLAIIARDRALPIRELLARVRNGLDRWRQRWAELDDSDRGRRGTHVTLGDLTVSDVASRFVAGHVEDHLDQLLATLGDQPLPG
jgi:hypothetical protein